MVLARKLRRPKALAAAALLLFASIIPLATNDPAKAYGLIQNRKITMSSSANGNTTDGQGLTYEVEFDVANTEAIEGIVVDFCSDSPIVGDVCTAPVGFDTHAATVTLNQTAPLTGFSIDTTNSTTNTFILTNTTGYTPGTNETLNFNIVGIDNPETTNETFYARIITFNDSAEAQAYDSTVAGPSTTNPGDEAEVIDAGGIALSTANQINVTSKVQEKLTFCVYTSAFTDGTCNLVNGSDVVLGDTNGVLDTADEYVNKDTKYSVTTNASVDVTIRMKGDTLETGGFTIDATGAGSLSVPGDEQFGLCTYRHIDPDSVAGLTAADKYDGTDGSQDETACAATVDTAGSGSAGGDNGAFFAFDNNALTGTMSTYGETIAVKEAGDFSTGIIAMMGNISNTTEAGIYTTTLTFIATGTY